MKRLLRTLRSTPLVELLRHAEFRYLWIAVVVSQIGDWMQLTAQGWYVLEIGGNAAAVTTIAAAGILPQLLLNVAGGIAADRVPKRRLMRMIAAAQLIVSGTMAGLISFGALNVVGLVFFAFLLGSFAALWQPVYLSFIPEVVPEERLENAMGMSLSALYTARTLGPALAGLLIAVVGTEFTFVLNSLTFLAPVIALAAIETAGVPPARRSSPLKTLRASVRSVRKDGVLASLWSASIALSLFALPCLALIPVFAKEVFESGPLGLGVLMAASGAGQLAGAVALSFGITDQVRRSGLLQILGYVGMGVFLIGLALSPNTATAVVMLLGFNFLHGLLSPRVNAIVQRRITVERGTAQALFLLVFGMVPVGQILLGAIAASIGTAQATLWFGLAFTLSTLIVLISARSLREYSKPPEPIEPA